MSPILDPPLLDVRGLGVEFRTRRGVAQVLDGVGFTLGRGGTLGVVGESGCGKSVTALAVMRLIASPPGRITGGQVLLDGLDLLGLSEPQMQAVRGKRVSMIFQEPMTSLNPAYTVGEQIAEVVRRHERAAPREAWARAVAMLEAVGIPAAARRAHDHPHQFSGGMCQRVMIATALVCRPDLLVADEPTTALDVTVQAQIFDLIADLRDRFGTAVMLITHDMGAVAEMADRVVVMYAGHIVESGAVAQVLREPLHPYTRGLIACAPGSRTTAPGTLLEEIPGSVPSLIERGPGCLFADRCPRALAHCRQARPPVIAAGHGRTVMCWLHAEAGAQP